MVIDRAYLAQLLADLVRIPSVNPDLIPGGSGEEQIARYVAEFLERAGLEARLQEIAPGRFNAIGMIRGRGDGRSLMLNGHLDTVGVAGMSEAFSARVEEGRLYGRGALDMKGGLAAALVAVEELARGPRLKGDLVVAAVADEEHHSLGTRALLREIKTDAAIVMEPTNLEVATAHKGFAWAEIEVRGRAAHGSRPAEGLDAIVFMGRVLNEVEQLQGRLDARRAHPLLGCGSVHASLISGGQELSSYPEVCQLSLERRLLPGESAETFERELAEIVSKVRALDLRFGVRYDLGYWATPLETSRESPIAQTLFRCVQQVIGDGARFGAQTFWTDAALLSEAGIPTVLFGPGGAGLHSTVEYVRLEAVELCAMTLVEAVKAFCGD